MRTSLLTVVAVLITSSAFAADPAKKYALLIGVTKYSHAEMNKPPLEYPEADAKAVGDFLKQHGYEVDLLLGSKATRETILQKLELLGAKGNAQGAVVLGLWGHGVEFAGSDEAMFCPFDTTIRLVSDQAGKALFDKNGKRLIEPDPKSLVGMSKLLAGLQITGAGNRLLLADCCRESPNRPRGRAFGSQVKLTDLPDNTAAIFACSSNEQAFEHRDWGHGAMTKCLLDLLPRLATDAGDVNSITGRLRRDVTSLVTAKSRGRDQQTVQPIVNGVVELRLTRTMALLAAPFTAAEARSAQQATARSLGVRADYTNSLGMQFQLLPAGEFSMGSSDADVAAALRADSTLKEEYYLKDERPQHRVRFTGSLFMGTHEVTQKDYETVMGKNPSDFQGDQSRVKGMDTTRFPV
ncbi:MAG: caspase family protein, partial [Planctomycetota bacterium]|nr:caspase family protein [Planctomycetota bacterium]